MRGRRGFTLVELLVVLGLLSAFTYLAFRLLSGGLTIWQISDESRDQEERARVVLDLLRRDLGVADGSPRSRFVVDHDEKNAAFGTQSRTRLRFVRTINRADEARLRAGFVGPAGPTTQPAVDTAAAPTTVGDPGDTKVVENARVPSIGLLEVAYTTIPDPNAKDPAVGTLRRAVNLVDPFDTSRTFFARDFFDRAKLGFLERSADVAGGILHFGIALASQNTRSMDAPQGAGGPEYSWDSTRYEFSSPKDSGPSHFSLSSETPLQPRDRVYPRRVQILLILEREDPDRRRPRLATGVDAKSSEFRLDDPRPLGIVPGDLLKIEGEWLVAGTFDKGKLMVGNRGSLDSRSSSHNAGAVLHRGRIFRLELPVDCARDADGL
jgi:prepilin-type N-terminal cleavage/methylation domain-containing protein